MTASLRSAVIWSHHVGMSFCYTVGLIVLPRCVDALVLQEGLSVLVDAILHGLQFTHMFRFAGPVSEGFCTEDGTEGKALKKGGRL